ncbi:Transposon Tn7 transposition protein TnsB [compost metagenome]|uniref:Integrase catalytic domain-containing protein n=1 Tax=Pseudomonas fluorescens TaxID=294 RepID=A0A5E7RPG9_PSEFL|nr:DDE-type integrase/transposase/recombinase [Pseudomonas fluorescens]VVP75398.1 hypothetical protein PS938_00173 [Pseudomonas fluorescens]
MKSLPIRPGAQYALYQDIHEIITVDPTQIALRSIKSKHYVFIPHDTFRALQVNGELTLHQQAPIDKSLTSILVDLNTKQSKDVQRKAYYLRGLGKKYHGSLPHSQTINELTLLAAKIGDLKPPCYTTVYTWFREYRSANFNPLALLKHPSNLPRGKQLNDATHTIIREHMHEFYLKRPHPTVKTLYRFICSHIENTNRANLPLNIAPIEIPSLSTVHRAIRKINRYLLDLHHHGLSHAQKSHKYGLKHEVPAALLAVVEGDSHLVDLELVDENGNNMGRPWLFILIEVMTRCIIGWELSFVPPCAEKVLRAFRMALETSEDSEPGGRMEELVLDNGMETANQTIQNIAAILGFKLTYGPPGCPDVKAHIERFFGTLNTNLIHAIPGTTYSNREMKGDYNSDKKACLTLEKLNDVFSRWIRDVYHDFYHTGIHQTPHQAWTAALAQQLPPERYSREDLDGLCRSIIFRKCANGCVHFLNLSWTGPALSDIAHRLKANQKAMIYYDPSNLSTVWVAHPERPTELFEAIATDPHYQNHLTLFEHKLVLEQLKKERLAFSDVRARQTLLEIHKEIQLISEGKKAKATTDKNKVKKTTKKTNVQRNNIKKTSKTRAALPAPAEALRQDDLDGPTAYPIISPKDDKNE